MSEFLSDGDFKDRIYALLPHLEKITGFKSETNATRSISGPKAEFKWYDIDFTVEQISKKVFIVNTRRTGFEPTALLLQSLLNK